jgi:hypothetical protein
MKRWFGALLPLIVACSSSSTPAQQPGEDAAAPPASDGSAPPQPEAAAPSEAGTSDATTPPGDAGPPPPPADAGAAAAAACGSWASAFCTQLSTCSSLGLQAAFGDEATCAKRVAITCVGSLAAPGSGATVSSTNTCAAAIPSTSCASFLASDLGPSCAVAAGTVAANGACAFDAQCATKFCAIPPSTVCGTCQPPTTVGGSCSSGACSSGTFCDTKTSKCVVTSPADAGAVACDIQAQCDLAHGVACDPVNNTCDYTLVVGSAGGACGLIGGAFSKTVTVCPAAGTCPGLGAAMPSSTCVSATGDGQTCDAKNGPGCLGPAVCVSGKCTVPDGAACH